MGRPPGRPPKIRDYEFESTQQLEDNKVRIQEENKRNEEDQEIAGFRGLPQEGETRDELLDRIRKMRDEKPAVVEVELLRSEAQQKEFELEQEAGRAAVAKAEAIRAQYEGALQQYDAEGEKNQGQNDPGLPSQSGNG